MFIILMEREINYLGKKHKIVKFLSESENIFNKRLEFIKKMEKDKIEFKLVDKYSKIWSNIKYKNCKYMKKIYLLIKKYDKSI